jgi:hypothetical protein
LPLIERKALLEPLMTGTPGLQFNAHETGAGMLVYSCTNSPATSGAGARSCAISVALPHDRPQRPRLSAVGRAGDVRKYSQNRAADDIAAVLDHLHLNRAHVVGLSMGGFRRRSSPPEAQSSNFASLEAAPVANRRRVKGSSSIDVNLSIQIATNMAAGGKAAVRLTVIGCRASERLIP